MDKYNNVEKFELDIYGSIPRKIKEAEDLINEQQIWAEDDLEQMKERVIRKE